VKEETDVKYRPYTMEAVHASSSRRLFTVVSMFAGGGGSLVRAGADDKIRAIRNLRRYIQKAEKVVLNVARGQFPGEY